MGSHGDDVRNNNQNRIDLVDSLDKLQTKARNDPQSKELIEIKYEVSVLKKENEEQDNFEKTEELSVARSKLLSLEATAGNLEKKLQNKTKECEIKSKNVSDLQNEVVSLKKSNFNLRAKRFEKTPEKDFKQLLQSDEIEELNQEITADEKEIAKWKKKKRNKKLEEIKDKLIKDNAQSKGNSHITKEQRNLLIYSLSSLSDFKQQCNNLKQENAKMKKEATEAQLTVGKLLKEVEKKNLTPDELTIKLDKSKETSSALSKELFAAKQEIRRLKSEGGGFPRVPMNPMMMQQRMLGYRFPGFGRGGFNF